MEKLTPGEASPDDSHVDEPKDSDSSDEDAPAEPSTGVTYGLRVGSEQTLLARADAEGVSLVAAPEGDTVPTRLSTGADSTKRATSVARLPTDGETGDATPALTAFLRDARDQWEVSDGAPVVVSSPGYYTEDDAAALSSRIGAAGFEPLGYLREPLGAAYDADIHEETAGVVVLVWAGETAVDAAVLRGSTDGFEVAGRHHLDGFGAETVASTVAENLEDGTAPNRQVALEGFETELGEALSDLAETAGVEPTAVGRVELLGTAADEAAYERALQGAFGVSVRVHDDAPADAALARGAALAGWLRGGDVGDDDPTLARRLGVEVAGPDGQTVVPVPATVDNSGSVELTTTTDDQTRGRVTLVSQHRREGTTETVRSVEVTGLPPTAAGEVTVRLRLYPMDISPTTVDVTTEYEHGDATGTAHFHDINDEDVEPWFTERSNDPATVSPPEYDCHEVVTPNSAEPLASVSPTEAADRLLSVRNELADAARDGQTLSSDELRTRVRKVDVALTRAGVEVIDPSPGTEVDDTVHAIARLEPSSEHPDGTVIETLSAGYRLADRVEEPATVVVSDGPE